MIFAEVNVHLRETICDVTDQSQSFTKVMLVELEYYLERFSNQAFTKRLTVINKVKVCDLLWSQTQQSFKHEVGVDTDLQHVNIVKFKIVTLV